MEEAKDNNSDIEEYDEIEKKVLNESRSAFTSLEASSLKLEYSKELSKFTRRDYEDYNDTVHELNLQTRRKLIDFFELKAKTKIKEFHTEVIHISRN